MTPKGFLARVASLARGITNRDRFEIDTAEEFRQHIALRADDLERAGLSRDAAMKQAHQEFGPREHYREEVRAARALKGVDRIRFSALDLKLGVRMMARFPALTAISALGMAVAIALSTGYSSVARVLLDPSLPLPEGDRIVALQNWDLKTHRRGATIGRDIVQWKSDLHAVREIGAYRDISLNVVGASNEAEPVSVAEMTAEGFRVAGTRAMLGRTLVESDQASDAPPVVVMSHKAWTRRFAADSGIVGREIRLGTIMRTVVGVMPEGFAFPISHHFWIPLTVSPTMRAGSLHAFGKIAAGATIEGARAEIDLLGKRAAAELPETHATLRAEVHPYTYPQTGMDEPGDVQGARMVPLLTTLLLVIICINVAILIYARTALREGEIAVRTALGASRRRVVAQLFAESLVVSLVAAGIGLGIGGFALAKMNEIMTQWSGGERPFWVDFSLSPWAVVNAVGLAVLAAVITGVIPALKVTGASPHGTLQQLSAGAGSSRLGRGWTALIVIQIAIAVAALPVAVYQGSSMFKFGTTDPGFPAERFVSAQLEMEGSREPAARATYTLRANELARRLGEQGEVEATTFSSDSPGDENDEYIQDDSLVVHTAAMGRVDPGFMTVFGVPRIAGRDFVTADADSAATAVIVNQSFARKYFTSDGAALGRRVRGVDRRDPGTDQNEVTGPWLEIVGVVADFPAPMIPEQEEAKIYKAVRPGDMYPAEISVRLRESRMTNIDRLLRQAAFDVNPELQVTETTILATKYATNASVFRYMAYGIGVAMGSVMLLSAAGIYAMLSLAVTRRRREIAIRAALGAGARQILGRILVRAATPVIAGVLVGLAIIFTVDQISLEGELIRNAAVLGTVVGVVALIAIFSALEPARRGMRIEPSEALKQE